jgi:malto-oligosyltrehalose trehalohydrolase
VLENEDNQAQFLERDLAANPKYYAAQWNDDIHHAYHVLATGETGGYYADYAGDESGKTAGGKTAVGETTVDLLHRALTEGFIYQGDASPYRDGQPRGQKSDHLPANAFVSFLQNHDQIGNRAFGDRIASISEAEKLKALVAIQLLAPSIPLIFMGEEWGATSPFYYFCHLGADLAPLVTEGRRNEFARFPEFSDAKVRDSIPDPCQEKTFTDSKLVWSDLDNAAHQRWYQLYKNLLCLRKKSIVPLLDGLQLVRSKVADGAIYVTWHQGRQKLTLVANLSPASADLDHSFIDTSKSAAVLFASAENGEKDLLIGRLSPWSVIWLTA